MKKFKLENLIERFGITNLKIASITITTLLFILFVITVVLAIIAHNNMNSYTTITM